MCKHIGILNYFSVFIEDVHSQNLVDQCRFEKLGAQDNYNNCLPATDSYSAGQR